MSHNFVKYFVSVILWASSHPNAKVGVFFKIQEIFYMIGTRILKIDLEMTNKIEVKVCNSNIEIIFSASVL